MDKHGCEEPCWMDELGCEEAYYMDKLGREEACWMDEPNHLGKIPILLLIICTFPPLGSPTCN